MASSAEPVMPGPETPVPTGQDAPLLLRLLGSPTRRRILYALLASIVLFAIGQAVRPGFASPSGIRAVLTIASFVGLVAAGQTFVILIGGIDLSVPWVLNGASILMVTSSLGSNARAIPALLRLSAWGLWSAC